LTPFGRKGEGENGIGHRRRRLLLLRLQLIGLVVLSSFSRGVDLAKVVLLIGRCSGC
jgi:hypothetical protein